MLDNVLSKGPYNTAFRIWEELIGEESLINYGAEGGSRTRTPFGQRILSPVIGPLLNLTKRYEPVFTRLAVVKVSFRLAKYQHVPPPS